MQIKKFEAPTIQEALDAVKRELGPEAIILQTKQNKKGFGLMSKSSVEITAAVSERALQKKDYVDSRIPEKSRDALNKLPAQKQAEVYDKYGERYLDGLAEKTKEKVELSRAKPDSAAAVARQAPAAQPRVKSREVNVDSRLMADLQNVQSQPVKRRVTSTRYVDIDESTPVKKVTVSNSQANVPAFSSESGAQFSKQHDLRTPAVSMSAAGTADTQSHRLEEEVRQLKRIITEIKTNQAEGDGAHSGAQALSNGSVFSIPTLQTAYENLVLNGVDRRFAAPLIKKTAFELGPERAKDPDQVLDQIAFELMEGSETLSALASIQRQSGKLNVDTIPVLNARLDERSGPSILALVGPTGVGKTTTLAKIASEALLKRNLKVGLINLDSYKVAAFDQLATYAKILNVPFRSVASAEDFIAAIHDFQPLDLILIDTTGRSQKDPESLKEMEALLNSIPGVQTELVLSATTRDLELYDIATRFSIFKPQGLIFSKLDEATVYGAVYNVSQKAKLPLVYFTTGQRVPEDLEEATPERVASLILDL